jgi:integrase
MPPMLHQGTHAVTGEKSVIRSALTDATIRAMKPPEKGYAILWDKLPGFGCRISQAGTRAFVVLVASGRPKTIGRYPSLGLADARRQARKLLAEKTLGRTHPTHTAFDDALTAYLTEAERTLRPRTYYLYRRLLTSHYRFGRQNVVDITPKQILRAIDHLPVSEKSHVFNVGRTAFRWMERRHLIDRSPFARLDPPRDNPPRSRVLSEDELRAVYRTARAGESHFHRITSLLCLLGQRPQEIAGLQWAWIKGDRIEFPETIAKNKRAWAIPIGPEAQAILLNAPRFSQHFVFPALLKPTKAFDSFSHNKPGFDKACGVTGWQLRDLRRTFATNLQRLGVRLEVTEALLNHVSGSRRGIVGVYQQHQWADEKHEAIQRLEAYLKNL